MNEGEKRFGRLKNCYYTLRVQKIEYGSVVRSAQYRLHNRQEFDDVQNDLEYFMSETYGEEETRYTKRGTKTPAPTTWRHDKRK